MRDVLMTDRQLVVWLLQNGGPSIRYRAAAELLDDDRRVDLDRLAAELCDSPLVQEQLEQRFPILGTFDPYRTRSSRYEDAVDRLVQLGCRRGMEPFERVMQPFHAWLERELENLSVPIYYRTLVGAFLAMAGFHQDRSVRDLLARRLAVLYAFVSHDGDDEGPGESDGAAIPELLCDGLAGLGLGVRLPTIHDLRALAHLPARWYGDVRGARVDAVIEHVLCPEYQSSLDGNMIVSARGRLYPALGWNAYLPGYHSLELDDLEACYFVRRLALMARFAVARSHRWFRESVAHLETFRTERGTYLLPRRYLRQRRRGHGATGAYVGLEKNRRLKRTIELESTFWVLLIKKRRAR
jgi:hypothetical protein